MTSRSRRITRNTLFNVATGVTSSATLFVTGVVVARFLGPSDTGVYALVNQTIVVATTLAANGLSFAAAKFVAQSDSEEGRGAVSSIVAFTLRTGVGVSLTFAALLAIASGPLADAFNEPGAGDLFAIAAVVTVPRILTVVVAGPLQGLQRQAVFLPLALVQGLLLLGGSVGVLVAGEGLLELLLVQLAVAVLVLALHVFALGRARVGGAVRLERAVRSRMTSYGLSLTGMAALDLIVWQRSEVFLLGIFRNSDEVAFYSIAFATAEAVQQLIPTAFSTALFPNLARAFATGDRSFMERAYESSVRVMTLVTLPVAIAGSLLAVAAIETIYGPDFAQAAVALQILLFSAGAGRIGYAFSSILFAGDRERLILGVTAGWAVLNVALGLVLVPAFGVVGAAVSNAFVQVLAVTIGPFVIRRTFGLHLPLAGMARTVLATVPLALGVLAIVLVVDSNAIKLALGILVAAPLYSLGVVLSGALRAEERAIVAERLPRWAARLIFPGAVRSRLDAAATPGG